jgi:SAM-dependent methyltransferase
MCQAGKKIGLQMRCNVCDSALGEPIFSASSEQSLTSLCELRAGRTQVWACDNCGHLRGEALPDTDAYYESAYRISLDHEDEDQIYEVRGDRIVFRNEHQLSTLLEKVTLPQGAMLLDYGCAKAAVPKRLLQQRADVQVHLFDVSDMYAAHWEALVPADRRAVHHTPPHWQGRFEVITSFFALEHIPSPKETVRQIAAMLREDGVFYGIVPDTFGNAADFVVIDHVNHFTVPSLHRMLAGAGFAQIEIDATVHRGALVFVARRLGALRPHPDVAATIARALELADFWDGFGKRILAAELAHRDAQAAIYGSGFYGAYIASTLRQPDKVQCFLDRNPYQQAKTLFGKPILAPEQLPESVRVLYAGLNPSIARGILGQLEWLQARKLKLVFMDSIDGEAA